MQTQDTFSHQALKSISNIVLDTVDAEKIFLLPTQSSVTQSPMPEGLPSAHFLILTKDIEPYNPHELRRKLERECFHIASIHIILHDIHAFNTHLQNQQYFFPELSQSTTIFNRNRIPLAPRPPMNTALVQRSLHQSFSPLHSKSEQLLQSATEQWKQGIRNIEALAEAICHLYTAIEIVFTGQDPHTSDLFRLRRSTSRFSTDIALLFPYHSAKERQLFNRLHRTSMQQPSRGKAIISGKEYEATLRRAHEVQMVALLACQHHINMLMPLSETAFV